MGRKFRLCCKKNDERKRYQVTTLRVSIPLTNISVFPVSIPLSLLCCSDKNDQQGSDNAPMMQTLTMSLPLKYFTSLPLSTLDALHTRLTTLQSLQSGWTDATVGSEEITLCHVTHHASAVTPTIDFTLRITKDFTWTLFFRTQRIEPDRCPMLAATQPALKSPADISNLTAAVSCSRLCIGNPDEKFHPLLIRRQGVFMDQHGIRTVAREDTQSLDYPTIRHNACDILLPENSSSSRCEQCQAFRPTLRAQLSRHTKANNDDRTNPHSRTPYRCLDKEELTSRLRQLSTLQQNTNRKVKQLKAKLEAAVERAGHTVDQETHSDLLQIVEKQNSVVSASYPTDSFARIFWEQQLKAASNPLSKGMRWHPLMIKWALYLQYQSSGAYETLRTSGCIALPSQRTLRDYSHHTKAHTGFSDETDQQLMSVSDVARLEEWQKCVIVLMDEMHIREDLVYDKHTGALIGFSNLGDINSHLQLFEQSVEADTIGDSLAKTMLVIMVRGLFTKLQYPFAQFPCSNLRGDQIFDPFWEAVYRIERCTLKVVGATFDGASPNRRFLKLHGITESTVPYKIVNPYAADGRMLFFFSDPPHLLKTTRNCWSSKARMLWNNGKRIAWKHLEDLYVGDSGAQRDQPGLSLVPKLKYEHVHLNSFSRMRVDLAAQVLSNTVATALQLTGREEVTETVRFVKMFDKFFDSLNVGNFDSGKRSRNPFKAPYRSGNDFRLKWLEEDFLPYLADWEKSVEEREGFSTSEKKRMTLSAETLLGLRVTVNSFVELVRYLFTLPGVKVFLSRRLCQDPIEKFFGCQRQRGRTHDNPNVQEFLKNTQALRVVNGFCRDIARGNCRGNKTGINADMKENRPLPKRKQKRVSI